VIYVGNRKMNIQNGLSFNRNHYEYELVDIRNMDPEVFKCALATAEKMLKDGVYIPLVH
jgi:hypothetical protein